MTRHKLSTCYVVLKDGTELEAPLTLTTKLAYERTARANRWTHEANPFATSAFFAFHATLTAGQHELTWDQFLDQVADAGVENEDKDKGKADDGEGDPFLGESPTQPAQ